LKLFAVAGISLISALAMNADVITLTFEGLKDQESVNNFYNGGLGGSGSGPGPSDGITFTSDSLALISNTAGGGGNFDGQPSGTTIVFFLSGAGDTMNIAGGFTTGFSFYYSSPFFVGSINVYSGLNGTGTILTTLVLPETPAGEGTAPCNSFDQYCPWVPFGVSFSGTAESVVFSGTANQIGFDNITLGASVPTSGAPEPASWLLLVGGLSLVGLGARWRRNRA
jgi:hypothetical protein